MNRGLNLPFFSNLNIPLNVFSFFNLWEIFVNVLRRKIQDHFGDSSCTDLKKIDHEDLETVGHGDLETVGHGDLEKINVLFY